MTKLKVFLKIFLMGAILFGFPVGLFFSLAYNFPLNLVAGMFSGIGFGLAVAFISTPKQLDTDGEEIPVTHTEQVELDLPYEKAFEKCLESVHLMEKVNKVKENKNEAIIKADINFSHLMAGDVVTIKLHKESLHKTLVTIKSRPWLPITVADGGRNYSNAHKIASGLKSSHPTVDKVLYGL